jgi:hypothetical protein
MQTTASCDLERVLAWFADGRLVRPIADPRPDLVDLMRAIAALCGAPGQASAHSQQLGERIGHHDHLVFTLVDGLGLELLREHARDASGFLAGLPREELLATFPSTTAVALTSLATGEHPASHGIPGWHAWLPEAGVVAEILPFVERFSKRPLADFGLAGDRVLTIPSVMRAFARDRVVVTRAYVAGSTYSRWWSGESPSIGYDRIPDAIDAVIGRVLSARAPTYTYLYLNQLDSLCHERGVTHPEVRTLLATIDRELERLHAGLRGRARLVISADHGHVDAGPEHIVAHDSPLAQLLRCPPSGESRVPLFHVRPDERDRFHEGFARAHGEAFALLPLDEVEALRLLGPDPLSPAARERFGDFMGIAHGYDTLRYRHPQLKPHRNLGVHAGLTPAEMIVPLLLG